MAASTSLHRLSRRALKKPSKSSERRTVSGNEVRSEQLVQAWRVQLRAQLDHGQVRRRRGATDRPVGPRTDRGLVNDALAVLVVDAVVVAPLLREDVVDVDGEVDVLDLVECLVLHPVARTAGEDECSDALVCSGVPGSERVETRLGEVRVLNRSRHRLGLVLSPERDHLDVTREPRLDREP